MADNLDTLGNFSIQDTMDMGMGMDMATATHMAVTFMATRITRMKTA
jgi:hypothetical protein